ncbi:hypothetical protein GCM10022207_12250 [Streptomyces lannensis]|uniref:Uncharacterized protein n=1 Tax=Streptomyces lannensis TaxID=766498 RepID=A0ABP7JQJ8_9ACTN
MGPGREGGPEQAYQPARVPRAGSHGAEQLLGHGDEDSPGADASAEYGYSDRPGRGLLSQDGSARPGSVVRIMPESIEGRGRSRPT